MHRGVRLGEIKLILNYLNYMYKGIKCIFPLVSCFIFFAAIGKISCRCITRDFIPFRHVKLI